MNKGIGTALDRVMAKLIASLEIKLGSGASEALTEHFLKGEKRNLVWNAQFGKHWIGPGTF